MSSFYSDIARESLGVGVGLRTPHVVQILRAKPALDWFELLADNHMVAGGWARRQAIEVAQLYPVTMHCVGMSIGSLDPLNYEYLNKVKALAAEVKPKLISDHLCWTSYCSHYSHDLLPLPFTEEALGHVVERINKIQDFLGRRIAIENVSSYMTFEHSSINEVEFVNAVAQQADCSILFDLNNLYVNHVNNGQDAQGYLDAIDLTRVAEIHLAGFERKENYLLDAHNNHVHDDVWNYYQYFLNCATDIPTLIEWDHNIPAFEVLYAEAMKAKTIKQRYQQKQEQAYAIA